MTIIKPQRDGESRLQLRSVRSERRPLVVVTGTGTGIGKTFFASALVRVWSCARPLLKIAGAKPVESGVSVGNVAADVHELGRVSTFHVTRFTPPYLLMDAVSPHLAARREGRVIELEVVRDWIDTIRDEADGTVVELAGGLFSPLSDNTSNASLLELLKPSHVLLVAPNRLGVLHDVIATTLAAQSKGIVFDAIVLGNQSQPDASSPTNAAELQRMVTPIVATIPWSPPTASTSVNSVTRPVSVTTSSQADNREIATNVVGTATHERTFASGETRDPDSAVGELAASLNWFQDVPT